MTTGLLKGRKNQIVSENFCEETETLKRNQKSSGNEEFSMSDRKCSRKPEQQNWGSRKKNI